LAHFRPAFADLAEISENARNISRLLEFNGLWCTLVWNPAGGTEQPNSFPLWPFRNAPCSCGHSSMAFQGFRTAS
jgi:hypothetical protein